MGLSPISRPNAWFRSYWFNASFVTVFCVSFLSGLFADAPLAYVFGQLFLAISFYFSMRILADRPLLNPIQFVAILFYIWFGAGPSVVSLFKVMIGDAAGASEYQQLGMNSLWIVSIGVLVFSFVSKHTIRWAEKKGIGARFLQPEGDNYRLESILLLVVISFSADIIVMLLSQFGVQGVEEVDLFGGTRINIWWVGIIDNFSKLQQFSNCALMVYLSQSWSKLPKKILFLGIFVLGYSVANALLLGSKGAFFGLFFCILVAWISRNQRIPWKALIPSILLYFLVVEPYVATGRYLTEIYGGTSSGEQKEVYRDMLRTGDVSILQSLEKINIASPFRGIYELAGDITRNNSLFEGEWRGYTINWGLEAIVPRVILPDKRDLSVGNYFYHTVYARTFGVSPTSETNNVSVSMPFEFVGNYGYLAGILAFALIGCFFSLLCCYLLSVKRLHSHPLTPMLILLGMGFEGAFGHWLARLRVLLIPLVMIYFVRLTTKYKL